MTKVNVPNTYQPRQQPRQFVRNSQYPQTSFQSGITTTANQLIQYRSKQFAAFSTWGLQNTPVGATGTRNRWRFAGHTSPYGTSGNVTITAEVTAVPSGTAISGTPTITLTITNPAGTTTYGSGTCYLGNNSGQQPATPNSNNINYINITSIPQDTDIVGVFTESTGARLTGACVSEVPPIPDTANGYINSNVNTVQPVYDTDRANLANIAVNYWKRGAAPIFTWASDTDALATNNLASVPTNIIDNTSTTPSSQTPGFTIDLTNRARENGSGVNVTMAVYYENTIATGNATLVNQSGTALLTTGSPTATPGWYYATGTLPATVAKYDIMANSNGWNMTIYAVSLYLYTS